MHQVHTQQVRDFENFYQPNVTDIEDHIICDWSEFRTQLLGQWDRLTANEIDNIGPNRARLAHLVERKYGIASLWVENYLRNFERTLPL